MKVFTSLRLVAGSLLLTFALCATARATLILDVSSAITLTDPTQSGRLSRNGIPQDWAGTEPFPGLVNTTTVYHYHTYAIDALTAGLGPFMQISFDSIPANTFVSAYSMFYHPNSVVGGNLGFDTNWLGDAGFSGNSFGVDPVFFQVMVPLGSSLVVVVNTTAAANGGIGDPFHLLVESFTDTNFTDAPSAVPEPSTYGLFGAAFLAGLSFLSRRRKRQSASQGSG
jgi:PEP-CTERM motif